MARSKKMTAVVDIVNEANRLMALPDSQYNDDGFRRGVAALVEHVLHQTGNYAGFQYADWHNGGCRRWQEDGRPEGNKDAYLGNETRRIYFCK